MAGSNISTGSDSEIDAMQQIASAMATLEDEVRGRVLRWATERYGVGAGPVRHKPPVVDDPGLDEVDAGSNQFDNFADVFSTYGPTTDVERVLVAAYWFQVILGKPSFQAAELNKECTNLGHALSNVTVSLSSNIAKKPQLVLQVGKSGKSRQARKTYKLTGAGMAAVRERLL